MLSHISIRRRNQTSAGVLIIRGRNNYTLAALPKIFEFYRKNPTVPKTVAQCRKYPIPYLNTLNRTIPHAYTLPNAIAYLNTCIPILTHALPILIH